jgi:hypothetical protein
MDEARRSVIACEKSLSGQKQWIFAPWAPAADERGQSFARSL